MKKNELENNGRGLPVRSTASIEVMTPVVLPDGNGGFVPCPELLTEEELILFLRIPNISNAKDYSNVIDHLKRMHCLPRIHICGKILYPTEAIKEWIRKKTTFGK
jgi:hypothetical protein